MFLSRVKDKHKMRNKRMAFFEALKKKYFVHLRLQFYAHGDSLMLLLLLSCDTMKVARA